QLQAGERVPTEEELIAQEYARLTRRPQIGIGVTEPEIAERVAQNTAHTSSLRPFTLEEEPALTGEVQALSAAQARVRALQGQQQQKEQLAAQINDLLKPYGPYGGRTDRLVLLQQAQQQYSQLPIVAAERRLSSLQQRFELARHQRYNERIRLTEESEAQ